MITNDKRKILQDLQTHIGWPVLEEFIEEYIKNLDLNGSIKRNNEFETIWQRAHSEGGREHLRGFLTAIESEARKYI